MYILCDFSIAPEQGVEWVFFFHFPCIFLSNCALTYGETCGHAMNFSCAYIKKKIAHRGKVSNILLKTICLIFDENVTC